MNPTTQDSKTVELTITYPDTGEGPAPRESSTVLARTLDIDTPDNGGLHLTAVLLSGQAIELFVAPGQWATVFVQETPEAGK